MQTKKGWNTEVNMKNRRLEHGEWKDCKFWKLRCKDGNSHKENLEGEWKNYYKGVEIFTNIFMGMETQNITELVLIHIST